MPIMTLILKLYFLLAISVSVRCDSFFLFCSSFFSVSVFSAVNFKFSCPCVACYKVSCLQRRINLIVFWVSWQKPLEPSKNHTGLNSRNSTAMVRQKHYRTGDQSSRYFFVAKIFLLMHWAKLEGRKKFSFWKIL